MKTVCVLGDGAWGTAIATLLAHNGFTVKLWCYQQEVAKIIETTHCNERYLPGVILSPLIVPTTDFEHAVADVQWIFEAVPVQFLRTTITRYRSCITPQHQWVLLSKGIEQDTLLFPSELIDDVLGFHTQKVVLVGPGYAQDLAQQQPTAFTLAAHDCAVGVQVQSMVANDYCRTYITGDFIGAQVGAALKNVIALAVGMLDGAGFTDNTKAFMLTRGLREMVVCACALGGTAETIYGLSGVGDLVLTAMGHRSKNREVGRRLGAGQSLETILQETGFIPEGVSTAQSMYQLMVRENLDLPICRGVYEVIKQQKTVREVVVDLMKRPLEQECAS